jgi:hypothetical protein
MNIKMLKAAFAGLVLSVSGFANAGIISGTEYTDDGKVVDLQNLEWLTWDETYGVSRNSIEAGYNGLLSKGWRYATTTELGNLFTSIWGGQDGWNTANHDGSQWLWENFDNADFLLGSSYSRSGDLQVGATVNYLGHWRAETTYLSDDSGWFHSNYGAAGNYSNLLSKSSQASSVLVRSVTDVPEPSTLAIFALGMIGLASRRFKKQS